MAITYPLTLPSSDFKTGQIGADFNNLVTESLSRVIQSTSAPGDLLLMRFTLPKMENATARAWVAFGMKLRGSYGSFYGWDPYQKNNGALGAYGGTPLVAGADQSGYTLAIDGASINVTDWAKEGDWIEVNGLLRMVTEDADSDGSGNVSLEISPGIGAGQIPADNDPITTGATAKGTFRLTSDRVTWDLDVLEHYGMSFDAVEDLRT